MADPPVLTVVTFAGGSQKWLDAQERLHGQLAELDFVKAIRGFTAADLPRLSQPFPQARQVLSEAHPGLGYWLWKPLVIRECLTSVAGADQVLLYLDVGCEINANRFALRRLRSRIAWVRDSHVLAEQVSGSEERWSKRDLLQLLDPGDQWRYSPQVSATWILFRMGAEARDFVETWIDICLLSNFHFLDDSPSILPENDAFMEHRHDQSIMSLLYKERGFPQLEPDWQWASRLGAWRGADRPVWTLRNRSGSSRVRRLHRSALVGLGAAMTNSAAAAKQRFSVGR